MEGLERSICRFKNLVRLNWIKNHFNDKELTFDAVKAAVYAAYGDIQRSFKGIGNYQESKTNALCNLSKEIHDYLSTKQNSMCQAEFDTFHDQLCSKLIKDFGDYKVTYGQVQKIVNMTFKYLYCCDFSKNIIEKYKFCHVAIDNYMLIYFKRKYKEFFKERVAIETCKEIDSCCYKMIQEKYREIKDRESEDFNSCTMLEYEIIKWQQLR